MGRADPDRNRDEQGPHPGAGGARLLGVGIGIAGSITHRDAVVEQTREAVEAAFAVPVILDNNTRLAGLAEHVWGAARGLDDVVCLRLAARVGGAVVLDGEMRLGPRTLAGELGHVNATDEPLPCRCGNRGCLETLAGRDALLEASGAADLDALAHALATGDRRADRAVQRTADAVGRVLAGACTTLDVTDVVLAGELLQLGDHLLDPVRASLARHALRSGPDAPRLRTAQLGQAAGALGGIGALLRDPHVPMPLTDAVAS